ncbi:hypothetical protein ACP70R_039209 [Stipagrostis hirtigluma subsp. patula]
MKAYKHASMIMCYSGRTLKMKIISLFARNRAILEGLATDGFNPFGIMSSSYSVWPVVVVVYNLPPWRSMKEAFILMPLLILGKKGPGRDIDVYLRPLVEELKTLFSVGAITYDAVAEETFNLRGVVLWTIHDLPALGSVFGYVPMGYKAYGYIRGRGHGPKPNRRASSSSTSSQQVLEAELAATKLVVATQQATIETQQAKIDHQDKRIDWLTSVMCKMAGISPPPMDDIDIAGQGCSNTWTTSSDGQGSLVSDGISRR